MQWRIPNNSTFLWVYNKKILTRSHITSSVQQSTHRVKTWPRRIALRTSYCQPSIVWAHRNFSRHLCHPGQTSKSHLHAKWRLRTGWALWWSHLLETKSKWCRRQRNLWLQLSNFARQRVRRQRSFWAQWWALVLLQIRPGRRQQMAASAWLEIRVSVLQTS